MNGIFMKINPVIQEENSGCGIASVAVLAGISYAENKRIANDLNIYAEDHALWSDTRYVRRLLEYHGIKASDSEIPFVTWDTMPSLALLSLKWHLMNGRPHWHWAVFARDTEPVVLDSGRRLKNHVRKDFFRMKPKWFIQIMSTHNYNEGM
ncbi:MAG: hypothetical protein LBS49_07555 [Candidatus Accumulibacter sp.]|jgi:hypothetical protein|nr:hypothetical protein [Accumulibacter sp.]